MNLSPLQKELLDEVSTHLDLWRPQSGEKLERHLEEIRKLGYRVWIRAHLPPKRKWVRVYLTELVKARGNRRVARSSAGIVRSTVRRFRRAFQPFSDLESKIVDKFTDQERLHLGPVGCQPDPDPNAISENPT